MISEIVILQPLYVAPGIYQVTSGFKKQKSPRFLVQKITFSFLIIHREFQDTITYEVDPAFTFEDAINHICNSFDFDRNNVSIRSNLGVQVNDLMLTVEETAKIYGIYYKLVVDKIIDITSNPSSRGTVYQQSVEADIEITREGRFEEWHAVDRSSYIPEDIPYPEETSGNGRVEIEAPMDINMQENEDHDLLIEDVVNQVLEIAQDRLEVDEDGLMEITILPQINTYISQLKVKFKGDRAAKELFTKVSVTCGYLPREVLVVPLSQNPFVLSNLEPSVHELIQVHGSVYLLFSIDQSLRIERDPQFLTAKINQIMSTTS